MTSWQQVMVLTETRDTALAYERLCRYDENHEGPASIEDVSEAFDKIWNEGPVSAFKLDEDSYYSVALSKSPHSYPPFDFATMEKAFPIEETCGSKAYGQCSIMGLSSKGTCLKELCDELADGHASAWFENHGESVIIERQQAPAKFAYCTWAACDAYATPERSRIPAMQSPCFQIEDVLFEDFAGYDCEDIEKIFERYRDSRSISFKDWHIFGSLLVEAKETCTASGFARSLCIPTAAIVTPDGIWHDAQTDYEGNDNAWTANFYDDIIRPHIADECYATRFLAEDW